MKEKKRLKIRKITLKNREFFCMKIQKDGGRTIEKGFFAVAVVTKTKHNQQQQQHLQQQQ